MQRDSLPTPKHSKEHQAIDEMPRRKHDSRTSQYYASLMPTCMPTWSWYTHRLQVALVSACTSTWNCHTTMLATPRPVLTSQRPKMGSTFPSQMHVNNAHYLPLRRCLQEQLCRHMTTFFTHSMVYHCEKHSLGQLVCQLEVLRHANLKLVDMRTWMPTSGKKIFWSFSPVSRRVLLPSMALRIFIAVIPWSHDNSRGLFFLPTTSWNQGHDLGPHRT